MKPQVVVLGGGFAGLSAIRALRRVIDKGRCEVTLVEREACTSMIPALPDYAAGLLDEDRVTAPLSSCLPRKVRLSQGTVLAVDLDAQLVTTSSEQLRYDFLVLALGSAATATSSEDAEDACALATLADARDFRLRLADYQRRTEHPHVLISGAGYTGIELALCLAGQRSTNSSYLRVTVLEKFPSILPFLSNRQRQRVLKSLRRHDVDLKTGLFIETSHGRDVVLNDGTVFKNSLVVRTEGTCAPLRPSSAQALDALPDGRLRVLPDLSLPGFENVVAAGDFAALQKDNRVLRKAVNFAFYSGYHAGRTIAARLQSRPTVAFRPFDAGWVIPLRDDSVGRAFNLMPLFGTPGLRLHYFMCGYRSHGWKRKLAFARQSALIGHKRKNNKERKET